MKQHQRKTCKQSGLPPSSIIRDAKKAHRMPSFFAFQQGSESRGPNHNDSTPLLGRFRAVPDTPNRRAHRNSLSLLGSFSAGRSLGRGLDAVFGSLSGDSGEGEDDGEDIGRFQRWTRLQRDLWLEPKQSAVAKVVDKWWGRWWVLVILPAALVSCALCS